MFAQRRAARFIAAIPTSQERLPGGPCHPSYPRTAGLEAPTAQTARYIGDDASLHEYSATNFYRLG